MDYETSVLEPLRNDHGVACFAAACDGAPVVMFCDHTFNDKAWRIAHSPSSSIRAAHAIAIQRHARREAQAAGFEPLIA